LLTSVWVSSQRIIFRMQFIVQWDIATQGFIFRFRGVIDWQFFVCTPDSCVFRCFFVSVGSFGCNCGFLVCVKTQFMNVYFFIRFACLSRVCFCACVLSLEFCHIWYLLMPIMMFPWRMSVKSGIVELTCTASFSVELASFFSFFHLSNICLVALGGLVVACLPLDPRFAGSNPAEDDGC
jgi:hypothetical protein